MVIQYKKPMYTSAFDPTDPRIEESRYVPLHQITDSLWLGSSTARRHLSNYGITVVVSILTDNERQRIYPSCIPQVKEHSLSLYDSENASLIDRIHVCNQILDEAFQKGEKVLVHCMAGISRSASLVIGYLMYKEGLNAHEAFLKVERVRPCIWPNAGFQKQLSGPWLTGETEEETPLLFE